MLLVVKVGTGVLTQKDGGFDYNFIQALAEQIAQLKKQHKLVLISSGAVGLGRAIMEGPGALALGGQPRHLSKRAFASIGQSKLMQIYHDFFSPAGIAIAQVLFQRHDFVDAFNLNQAHATLVELLKAGVLPILNENDVVSDEQNTFGDNDQLAALIACILNANRLILLSDVEGFFTGDPKNDPKAELLKDIRHFDERVYQYCQNTLSHRGTGGMLSKLKAAELAANHGIATALINGKSQGAVLNALQPDFHGTLFYPETNKRKLKSTWIQNLAAQEGKITIDLGAVQALQKNKSLLAVGVKQVTGAFDANDVLLVEDLDGQIIAFGRAELASEAMLAVLEQPALARKGKIFIHKNNLFLYNTQTVSRSYSPKA